jgi:hypothetical protein
MHTKLSWRGDRVLEVTEGGRLCFFLFHSYPYFCSFSLISQERDRSYLHYFGRVLAVGDVDQKYQLVMWIKSISLALFMLAKAGIKKCDRGAVSNFSNGKISVHISCTPFLVSNFFNSKIFTLYASKIEVNKPIK